MHTISDGYVALEKRAGSCTYCSFNCNLRVCRICILLTHLFIYLFIYDKIVHTVHIVQNIELRIQKEREAGIGVGLKILAWTSSLYFYVK